MNLSDLKKLWKAKSIFDAVKKAHGDGYDFKVTAIKFAKNFAIVCAAVAIGAISDYFSIPANVGVLFGFLPEGVRDSARGLLEPLIAGAIFAIQNWRTHRLNEIVWVVPIAEPISAKKLSGETVSKALPAAIPMPISVKPPVPPETVPTIPKDVGA